MSSDEDYISEGEELSDSDEHIPVKRRKTAKEYYEFSTNTKEKFGICKLCKSREKKIKMTGGNTTGLNRHLKNVHPTIYEEIFRTPVSSYRVTDLFQKISSSKFDSNISTDGNLTQQQFNVMTVKWMAKKYLPFSFFDDNFTTDYFKLITPNLKVPNRNTLKKLAEQLFERMQNKIKDVLADNTSAISFTIDRWTAINGKSYYGITGHFITDDFKYHSIVLDFVASNGKHSGVEIAKMFFTSLKGYGILHKVQGITVDNCAANSTFIQEFTNLMANDGFQFDSQNQHFRCVAHVLNLAVQSAISLFKVYKEDRELEDDDDSDNSNDEIEECDQLSPFFKLRMIFKKLKRSEQLQIEFRNFCNLFSEKCFTDCRCMYEMEFDVQHAQNWFGQWQLIENEWEVMQKFASFLKNFAVISTLIGGDKYVTLPMVVLTYNMVFDKIEATAKQLEQQDTQNVLEDSLMDAYQAAYDKMVCYYAKTNWICCVVLILDPRHKVETFNLTKWGKEIIDTLERFKNIFKEKYYVAPLQDVQPVLSSDDEDIDIKRCLHYFSTSAKLETHIEDCGKLNDCAIRLPSEDDKWLSFRNPPRGARP
ncbi:PREDICTED: uncharacterized protein LOC108766485 [Trachymyrmex cornetzi]|uniref:uncharacterized protein LOC108766485 n=1 Tax=Trachymyrmex cornetzi TaxID=471704 RepID=UPI00084F2C40|nr:PREDICTED: uncharacterized protein LOC108766485 [Trachymyrmex cornetzi]